MKSVFHFLSVLLVLITCNQVNAQDIFFNKVQPPDGRTFMHVTGMVHDRQGYMRLATKKGLFRGNGY
jgi:hypothetical protein